MEYSPQHDNAYSKQVKKAIWADPALIDALQNAEHDAEMNMSTTHRKKAMRTWLWSGAIAASLLIALVSWPQLQPEAEIKAQVISTGQRFLASQAEDVILSDGSEVALNRQASMQFIENAESRNVTLRQGEAYFSVQRDIARPFTVSTGEATIRVLGTAFNVDKTLSHTIIDVFHGKVSVANDDETEQVILTKGQRARVNAKGIVISKFTAEQPDWKLGWLDLDDVLINDAIYQLNRYTTKPLLLENVKPSLRVSGRFKTADIGGAAKLIAALNSLSVNTFDDSIVLSANH
jgi:transmembrane sensor